MFFTHDRSGSSVFRFPGKTKTRIPWPSSEMAARTFNQRKNRTAMSEL
jgi:hypothetical protein